MAKHPIQPLIKTDLGIVRFKKNALVEFLLDEGPFDMNDLARMDFSNEDREQFAQLIGCSFAGFCDLDYTSAEVREAAYNASQYNKTEEQARLDSLRSQLNRCKSRVKRALNILHKIDVD